MVGTRAPALERIRRGITVLANGCWCFNRKSGGYASFRLDGRSMGAHRASYLLHKGEIPPGLYVLHKCDNPLCVNPEHLFLGTQQENSDDKFAKGRGMEGDRHRNRKIDAATADLIRKAGGTQQWIADWFGISRSQVSRIKNGVNWRTSEEANARSERKL